MILPTKTIHNYYDLPNLYVTDATSEAIAFIRNNQLNNGFLRYFDELTALIGLQNAYRGDKGADAEKILSGRDGTGYKTNRAGGTRISCIISGYSILGGIQPDITFARKLLE